MQKVVNRDHLIQSPDPKGAPQGPVQLDDQGQADQAEPRPQYGCEFMLGEGQWWGGKGWTGSYGEYMSSRHGNSQRPAIRR